MTDFIDLMPVQKLPRERSQLLPSVSLELDGRKAGVQCVDLPIKRLDRNCMHDKNRMTVCSFVYLLRVDSLLYFSVPWC